mgnify:FL=1
MTKKEIADRVEGWNWNLSIFEIYDEVKDMGKYGFGGRQTEDLTRLLSHAYYYFNEDKIKKVVIDGVSHGATPMIKELASFLCVDIMDKEEKEEDDKLMEKQEKELDVELWGV